MVNELKAHVILIHEIVCQWGLLNALWYLQCFLYYNKMGVYTNDIDKLKGTDTYTNSVQDTNMNMWYNKI